MAYVHCHKCEWSQDDFWSETYNPIRYLREWEEYLSRPDFDLPFTNDAGFIRENGDISTREVIARELEKGAARIREMIYRTDAEMRAENPERECPRCGGPLDID